MHADSYRFLGWDYMDLPAKPCGPNDVSVSFFDAGQNSVSEVKFSFENGRIVRAEGWQRTFKEGPIPQVR